MAVKRLRVGLDVDGVLADFVSAFLIEAEETLGRSFAGVVQTTWNFEDSLDITKEEVSQVWKHLSAKRDWFAIHPKPFRDVSRLLEVFTQQYEVYFITSRHSTAGMTAQEQTQWFLYGQGVTFPTVLANFDKGEIAAALKLDVFLDDFVDNCVSVASKSPSTRVFMKATPYNTNEKGPWERVDSFEQFVEKVEELSNE